MLCIVYLCILLQALHAQTQPWQTARSILTSPYNLTLPSEASHKTWSDSACPSFLVEGNLLVTGDLFVKGRIQVLSSVDLSTFEEVSQENVTRQRLSKFAFERCRKGIGTDPLTIDGNLFLTHGNLIVGSGELTVLGSISSSGLLADGGGQIVANLRPLIEYGLSTGGGGGSLQARRSRQRSAKRGAVIASLDVEEDVKNDALCPAMAHWLTDRKSSEAIVITKGLLYLKNSAQLWTFGTVISTVMGLDRSSKWLARCASILAVDDSGGAGDIALLAASTLTMTGDMASLKTGQLVVSESSSVVVPADLDVEHVVKVSRTSELDVGGALSAKIVAVSDLAVAKVGSKGLQVSDVVILIEGGHLFVQGPADVTSMAAYDKSTFQLEGKVSVEENVVIDTGSYLILNDSMDIGGSLVLANSSSAHGPELRIGIDLNLLQSKMRVSHSLIIGCTIWAQIKSQLDCSDGVVEIRSSATSANCNLASPILHVTHSRVEAETMLVGGQAALPLDTETAPTSSVLLAESSELLFGQLVLRPISRHDASALVLTKGSRLTTTRDITGLHLCIIEEASHIQAASMIVKRLQLSDRSSAHLNKLETAWLQGTSRAHVIVQESCSLEMGVEMETQSTFESNGHTAFGEEFDHIVATAGGSVRLGKDVSECVLSPMSFGGSWVSQDGGSISVWRRMERNGVRERNSSEWTVMSESRSKVDFGCEVKFEAHQTQFKRTREASINFRANPDFSEVPKIGIYKVAVPPSDATSLQAFLRTAPMESTANRKEELWQLLSLFQHHVEENADRIMAGISVTTTPAPSPSPPRAARNARNPLRRSSQPMRSDNRQND